MKYLLIIIFYCTMLFAWPSFENNKAQNSDKSGKIVDESKQQSPLHKAIEKNDSIFDIMDLVEKKGVDVNAIDQYGDTALHYACRYNNIDAIEYLVQKGAKIKAGNFVGLTPMDMAIENSHLEAFNVLLKLLKDDRWINE